MRPQFIFSKSKAASATPAKEANQALTSDTEMRQLTAAESAAVSGSTDPELQVGTGIP